MTNEFGEATYNIGLWEIIWQTAKISSQYFPKLVFLCLFLWSRWGLAFCLWNNYVYWMDNFAYVYNMYECKQVTWFGIFHTYIHTTARMWMIVHCTYFHLSIYNTRRQSLKPCHTNECKTWYGILQHLGDKINSPFVIFS